MGRHSKGRDRPTSPTFFLIAIISLILLKVWCYVTERLCCLYIQACFQKWGCPGVGHSSEGETDRRGFALKTCGCCNYGKEAAWVRAISFAHSSTKAEST